MKRHFPVFLIVMTVPFAFLTALPGAIVSAQGAILANSPAPAPITLDQGTALPSAARAVMKMSQGGVDKDVILVYIQNSPLPYQLSAEGIIRLRTSGVPGDLIKAMIQRDGELQQQATEQYYQQQQRDDALAMQKASLALQFAAPMMNRPPQGPANMGTGDESAYPFGNDFGDFGYPGFGFGWPYYGGFGGFGALARPLNNDWRSGHEGRVGVGGFPEGPSGLLGGPGGFGQGGKGLHGAGNSQPGNSAIGRGAAGGRH